MESHKSHSIISSAKIISDPHPKTGAILVNLEELFLYDIERITMKSQGLYSFDKKDPNIEVTTFHSLSKKYIELKNPKWWEKYYEKTDEFWDMTVPLYLDEIIDESDGIMVARGDLGVEMPIEKVPVIQKNIINKCRTRGKPVVVATQMLESMVINHSPTRAEASDVANAIYDGTDAVMLSAESAVGKYPIESVSIMNKIIESVEKDKDNFNLELENFSKKNELISTTDAITNAAYSIARNAKAKAIITFSVSGRTSMRMSKERAPVQVISLSPSIKTSRKLHIVWGVLSCHTEQDANNTTEMVNIACTIVKDKNLAKPGDSIVITAGVPFGNAGSTNLLRIAKIIDNKDLT